MKFYCLSILNTTHITHEHVREQQQQQKVRALYTLRYLENPASITQTLLAFSLEIYPGIVVALRIHVQATNIRLLVVLEEACYESLRLSSAQTYNVAVASQLLLFYLQFERKQSLMGMFLTFLPRPIKETFYLIFVANFLQTFPAQN